MQPGFWEFSRDLIPHLARGAVVTVELTFGSFAIGLVLGLIAALCRIARSLPLRAAANLYVTVIRGTPALVQIMALWGALPEFGITLPEFTVGVLALGINSGAYIAEIIRAAIQSIDRGQMEAARSLGMSYAQAMRRIILPQTYRRTLPPLVNELVALTKDTSLVGAVALHELFRNGREVYARTFRAAETWLWVSVFYLAMTVVLSAIAARLERSLEVKE
ncbi:amino acid ABC transporter permease [Caldinitratiruptor microaerophilus]|uniref:Glutamine ABC transporter permease n=1 Tax=Caldinitratiruptor microaerophilus TaxID=671077 RepID=A0AA35CIT9_9FIRM|nr:amino acid ABC transporter permease [Caldinitratiruptor microaerophilus]BDG59143.1 glutamine ABC transporter permease [Caldinitratiruptor microaerophilus]